MDTVHFTESDIRIQGSRFYNIVPYKEIIRIEAKDHYCIIFSLQQKICILYSLENIQDKLPENFIRCHRSHITNLQQVQTYDKKYKRITLLTGEIIPVARSIHKLFLKRLEINDKAIHV